MICRSTSQKWLAVTAAATLFSAAGSVLAQPANDNCADATPVGAGGFPFTTVGATNEGNTAGACGASGANADVWFLYTPAETGLARANTCAGATYDTTLEAYTSCGGSRIVCNDDFCGLQSQISFTATAGVPVLIRVTGFSANTGSGTLTLVDPVGGGGGGPANDNCGSATPVGDGSFPYNSNGATTDGIYNCGFNVGNDVWFSYTAPVTGIATFSSCDPSRNYDTVMAVFNGCGGAILGCNDDSGAPGCAIPGIFSGSVVAIPVTQGAQYLVGIGSYNSGLTGNSVLTITSTAGGLDNDNCANATAVTAGSYNFSTIGASNDGTASCAASAASPDIWFSYTAPSDGTVVVDTCGSGYDTALNAFDGCGGFEIVCNDDACGLQSRINVSVTTGQTFLIRVAGFAGQTGIGVLNVADPLPPPANDDCANAQAVGPADFPLAFSNFGATTDGAASCGFAGNPGFLDVWYLFTAAETANHAFDTCGSFDTQLSLYDGCGGFEIACNDDACGLSSRVISSLTAGQQVLIRVAGWNGAQGSGNINLLTGTAQGDLCENAVEAVVGDNAFDNTFAGTDGFSSCGFGGQPGTNDVWFSFTAPQSGLLTATTCPGFDTLMSMFDGCGGSELACNDDSPTGLCSTLLSGITAGETYLFRVSSWGAATGAGNLNIQVGDIPVGCLARPDGAIDEQEACGEDLNGGCNDPAFAVETVPANSTIWGTAWADNNIRDTDWFEFEVASAAEVTISMESEFAGRIFLLNNVCPGVAILATNTTFACGGPSSVTMTVAAGTYRAFAGHNSFAGTPCILEGNTHYIMTIAVNPIGACCSGASCTFVTQAACDASGGSWLGAGTDCGATTYADQASNEAFEDISATGTFAASSNCDDCGELVAIGFDFNFFGNTFSNVAINSNGNMSFDGPNGTFGNVAIPNGGAPNNLVAPAWDDFNPGAQGDVQYELRGTAPNRRFIAQWTNVAQFANTDSNTFQAILFEGSNNIEFRYGNMTVQAAGDITVGVENGTGTEGLNLDATTVIDAGNTAVAITSTTSSSDCDATPCLADFNGDGLVFPDDLSEFITCFFLQVQFPGFCPLADFNGDGLVFPDDLSEFITTFFLTVAAGGC